MASKRGMTAQQAMYGIFDTILKNNFLGGALNPGWMKDPKVRALFLFQTTPFKIWERRIVNAYKAGQSLKIAGRQFKGASLFEIVQLMTGLKSEIKVGETALKRSMIMDALNSERDFFGTSVSKQLVKEMIISGLIIGGGASLGMDFSPQVGHAPFFNFEREEPTLRTAPIVNGVFKTMAERHAAAKNDEDSEFWVTEFVKNWLGNNGIVPITVHKAMRLSENDIPELYKEGPMKYLFSVPAK